MITPTPHLVALMISMACLFIDTLAAESSVMQAFSGVEQNLDMFADSVAQKESGWYELEKKIGEETVRLEYPGKPLTDVRDNFFFCTLDIGMWFSLITPNTPTGKVDAKALFDQVIRNTDDDNYSITSETRSKNGDDEILKITGFIRNSDAWTEHHAYVATVLKVYVTSNNYYIYGVIYWDKNAPFEINIPSDIDKFMNSFSVSH